MRANPGLASDFCHVMTDAERERYLGESLNLHATCEDRGAWRVYTTPEKA